jgi:hypothetical protein
VSDVIEQSRVGTLPDAGAFRLRMERQCHYIRLYRLVMLRIHGRPLSPDEAALEWIDRYAATFDRVGGPTIE